MTEQPPKKRRLSLCVGCGSQIQDQYILRVAPDLEWHANCLKCAECTQFLDENCTCFVKDGKTYCRRDYVRLFGTKCDKCGSGFSRSDFVMRAKNKIYHIECFRCIACHRQLVPGDEFALRDDGLYCKDDTEILPTDSNTKILLPSVESLNNNNLNTNNNFHHSGMSTDSGRHSRANSHDSHSDSSESCVTSRKDGPERSSRTGKDRSSGGSSLGPTGADGKPTRVRTVLNEKQLHTLRTCYNANPRPDALMKEQLVEMTGLSPRVIRVWFQNKRCKDKKKAILMKQMQQQEKDGRKLGYGGMQGIPLIASSPVRHESPLGLHPVPVELQVQGYAPPWKALADFALHTDLDRLDPNASHFQHLVNQMHGFDMHSDLPSHLQSGHHAPPMDLSHGHVQHPSGGHHHPMVPSGLLHGHTPLHDPSDAFVPYLDSDDSMQHDAASP